jgi:PAS domain S-box-containing protein
MPNDKITPEELRGRIQDLAGANTALRKANDQLRQQVATLEKIANGLDAPAATDGDETARRLALRGRQQAVIAQLGRTALAGDDSLSLCDQAVRMIADTLDVEYAKILRLEPDGEELLMVSGVGWREGLVGCAMVPSGIDSQAGYTLQSAAPVVSRDLRHEQRFTGPALLSDHGVISGMSVMIGPEDDPWGVLGAHARREIDFTVDDTNFIFAVANVLWEAIRREAVEAELRANQARTAAFLNNSAVIAWMKDDQGRYIYLSRTYERRFGVQAQDWVGHTDAELWPTDIAEQFAIHDREVLDTGEAIETVEGAIGQHGEPLHMLVSKFPFSDAQGRRCVGGLGVDITRRVAAEQALADSEERLRLAASMARFGTYFADLDEGVVTWSPELKAILGYPPDSHPDIGIGEVPPFVHPDDRAQVAASIAASLDPAGDGVFRDEHRVVRADGEVRWIWMQGRTAFIGEGDTRRPVRIAGIGLDITERRQAEQALERARRRAEAANEAKSSFLANMSHEIRTPLTAILGFADVLGARLDDPDDQAYISTIRKNGDHLRQILDDFLDLAKIEAGKHSVREEWCDAVAIVNEIHSLFAPRAAQKGLSLSMEREGRMPRLVRTDPKCLRQILLNLVGNAIKFTDRGGVRIIMACRALEQRLAVAVVDTGIGIDPAAQDSVFLAFEQVDSSLTRTAGGTGLGLSITKRLVDALGGQITVDSALDRGSTFRVLLPTGPLADVQWIEPEEDISSTDTPVTSADAAPAIEGQVLVVDDHPDIRLLVQELIEAAGAEVITARDGVHGIEQWREASVQGRHIQAILMDVHMPNMDGFEATRRLRAAGCRVPIIALTANAMARDREACLQAGFDDYISKPINRMGLLQTLATWMSRPADPSYPTLGAALSILTVDDNADSCAMQKLLLELQGHRVTVAGSGADALRALDEITPDAVLIDQRLGDMSGVDLLGRIKHRPELQDCLFICVTGQDEDRIDWRGAGFDQFLQKPVPIERLTGVLARGKPR